MAKLTQKALDAAVRARDSRLAQGLPYVRQLLRDHEIRGFTAIVHGGSVAFQFGYKPRGGDPATGQRFSSRYVRIGDTGTHTLSEAKAAARILRLQVQQGADPKTAALHHHAAATVAARQRVTIEARLPAYRSALATRGRSARYQREELNSVTLTATTGGFLGLTPEEITVPIVEGVLAACSPAARQARFGALDRFLRWSLKGSDAIPATARFAAFEKPAAPAARSRVLAGWELTAIWRAADHAPSPLAADLARFLIAIPCRRGEAAAMRWSDVNLPTRVWTMPTSKNSDPHSFPLNDRAMTILSSRRTPSETGHTGHTGYVFSGTGALPFCSWATLLAALRRQARVADWRLHDFRRAFATTLGDAGVDETLLDLILNHRASGSRGGVKGVYQRARRWPERVQALDAWNAWLDRQLGENVASLRRGRG
jgi:integrase